MLRKAAVCFVVLFAFSLNAQDARHFTLHYAFTVKDVPAGKHLRVWIPLAQSDQWQQVRVTSSTGDLPLKQTRETKFGNEMLYAEIPSAKQADYKFVVEYDIVRHERLALTSASMNPKASRRELQQFLQPDKLVPITGEPAEIAAKQVAGKTDPLDKARALYEYVFKTMRYDKTGTGWGRGDTLYACSAKKGNCTDFHSLFISMARSQGIPARFEIGFSLPPDKHQAEVAGYHCWSDFYVDGKGWIPVDISEAWKHPEKHDYFFGAHDVDRVQFTMGRDLRLNPPQDGEARNYFVYPYVEVDGKEYPNVSTAFSFADVQAMASAAR